MATRSNHGGGCCGSNHIHGFREGDDADTADLERIVRGEIPNNYLVEVILSNKQAREKPMLIAKLQELGFVYSSSWTGNHGTPVHRFERTGARLALAANTFNWQGMMASSTLSGTLPTIFTGNIDQAIGRGFPVMNGRVLRGSRVVINSPASQYNGRSMWVRRCSDNWPSEGLNRYRAHLSETIDGPEITSIVCGHLRLIDANNVQPPVAPQVHENAPANERPVAAGPVVVFETYHNHYQRNGRGAGYDNRELAREAAPRCRRIDRREIMSDGTVRWVDNV